MNMKENSTPRPNGFSVSFFKNFWELIKGDMLKMFQGFWREQLDIKRLNFGVITLVPKLKEANTIKQYRPICLLNVDYKCFTNVLTNRPVPWLKRSSARTKLVLLRAEIFLKG
jgi:hypothetical protein